MRTATKQMPQAKAFEGLLEMFDQRMEQKLREWGVTGDKMPEDYLGNMGVRALAASSEVSPGTISKLLNGKIKFPATDTIDKICGALKCDPNEFAAAVKRKYRAEHPTKKLGSPANAESAA